MGPNLTNITRVLSRIEEINHRIMPDLYHAQHTAPLKSKFVEVMNEVQSAGRILPNRQVVGRWLCPFGSVF